ncbi:antitoxin VapB family protein [Methanosarcina sp. T3]|uniref:antitoxin VapB family protein n=1 Tax=Methanosarcina sp. T3 TaxID=3439062 RepID=UPI003F8445B6
MRHTPLKNAKRKGESFSDFIDLLLVKEKENLSVYFGALKDGEVLERLGEDSRKIRELPIF